MTKSELGASASDPVMPDAAGPPLMLPNDGAAAGSVNAHLAQSAVAALGLDPASWSAMQLNVAAGHDASPSGYDASPTTGAPGTAGEDASAIIRFVVGGGAGAVDCASTAPQCDFGAPALG